MNLNASERAEITRKVKAYREMITNAAIKRKQRELKRHPRKIPLSIEQKIEILRRRMQGEKFKDIAKVYDRNPAYLSDIMETLVRDQMTYDHNGLGEDEWHRCLYSNSQEFKEIWMPLALQRLENR